MRRILLIGPGGAGKSTLARQLAERLALPLVHLDALYWQPGWVKTPSEIWQARVAQLLRTDAWVMDGNYGGTLTQRLAACDTAILLDLPPWLCLWRALCRFARHRGRSRPDMTEGCPEKFDTAFAWWILSYRRLRLPGVLAMLEAAAAARGVRVEVLRSSAQVERFLAAPAVDARVAPAPGDVAG